MEAKRKEFRIPNQIDGSVHLWRFVTVKDFVMLLPTFVLGYLVFELCSSFDREYRMIFALLPTVVTFSLLIIRPIIERKNIRLYHQLMWRVRYNQRQKQFYFRRKY